MILQLQTSNWIFLVSINNKYNLENVTSQNRVQLSGTNHKAQAIRETNISGFQAAYLIFLA